MKMKLKVTVEVIGESVSDLVFGLEEVARQVDSGYIQGANGNNSGSYNFKIEDQK